MGLRHLPLAFAGSALFRRKARARTVPRLEASVTCSCPCRSCPSLASAALFLPCQGLAVSAICG